MSRWTCPDCPADLPDAGAALEHEQVLGHGVPTSGRAPAKQRSVPQVSGQLTLPGVSTSR